MRLAAAARAAAATNNRDAIMAIALWGRGGFSSAPLFVVARPLADAAV
jgi:hypothetical protein